MSHAVKTEHCYVHKDLAVCGGDPVIVGTRIPVRLIYQRPKDGETIETIRQAYPHLTPAQIHDALSYAYDHPRRSNRRFSERRRLTSKERRRHPANFLDENIHAALAPQLGQRGVGAHNVYDLQRETWLMDGLTLKC